ncbi:MAG TPA: DUF5004 domain-containing protein [Saprospiraceae bacterium]|nr:DUF5004 domain-containing protein [Saprospiraceae bacterium]
MLFAAIVLVSCGSKHKGGETEKSSIGEHLIGEWQNTYLKVTINSVNGLADSVMVMEADTTNWEHVVHLKPIRTFFQSDGTYQSDHYAVNDSLLFSAKGTWRVSDDTLIMQQTSPNMATYRLKTEIDNNTVTFSGQLDFDEDGAEDDDYLGTQKKDFLN